MKPKQEKPKIASKERSSVKIISKFPIACIGASAGGLEALEQFLTNVPENSGIAYIVIQHLDPTQKGMLPELLQRVSKMPVSQVKDRMSVKPNCIYVIPPNKSMSILKGVLYLFDPIEDRGMRLPIDFFLRSLAEDKQELGIGVILSGMGSDGSIGVRAMKEKNGIVLVQDPTTAKFDSMPRNAIDSVPADIVAPANELPSKLIDLIKHIPNVKLNESNESIEIKDKSSLDKIIILLRTYTGNDFSLYKKNTVYRRIERRMGVHKIDKISSYVHFLQENPKEGAILFKELMIGVTNFFRDINVWEYLKEMVIPQMISKQESGTIFRAWIPGCSTGEEAYSLAIIFKEVLEKINLRAGLSLQIFATDLDNEAIEIARKGSYPVNISSDVSASRLNRFFVKTNDGYRVNTEIRETVVFAQHNIIMHPPFTKIDIISCRNLLIYMDAELQKKILSLFYYSLGKDGIMLLGSAETLGTQSHLFTAVESKFKIFKRSNNSGTPELLDFPSSFSRTTQISVEKQISSVSPSNIQTLADQMLLQYFAPSGVLVNDKGDIIYISGSTGKYLEPAVGKANLNVFAMLREGLSNEFSSAFHRVLMNKNEVLLHELKVGSQKDAQLIDIHIKWIEKPDALNGKIMIIFNDLPEKNNIKSAVKKSKSVIKNLRESELELELKHMREEIQNTLEEMQTSQEEQKSTNEELQSANEELQSTNEELTTSKEEMQSLNEELQTVNAELQSKVDEFSRVNNDMKNLLNSTDIATLFLDKDLNIRRFTNQATKIFKFIKSDIGRPFTDQVSDLIYPELESDANEVLNSLIFIQKQIPTRDGRWFLVRIMPYRTFDDRIDGLVITFINTSDLKNLEVELQEKRQMNNLLINSSSDVIIQLSVDGKIIEFNSNAEKYFDKKRKDAIEQNFISLFIPERLRKKTEKEFKNLLNEKSDAGLKLKVIKGDRSIKDLDFKVNVLTNNQELPSGLVITATIN